MQLYNRTIDIKAIPHQYKLATPASKSKSALEKVGKDEMSEESIKEDNELFIQILKKKHE